MQKLKTIYDSPFVKAYIVDTSKTSYRDSVAIRIVTYDGMSGYIDTVQPLNRKEIEELLELDDWKEEPCFYQALKGLYEYAPLTSKEPAHPIATNEL